MRSAREYLYNSENREIWLGFFMAVWQCENMI